MPLATYVGDLTVHCSCTLHMSRPPISGERRVIYTGFGLVPRPGDRVVSLSQEQIRNDRAVLNEKVKDHQRVFDTQPEHGELRSLESCVAPLIHTPSDRPSLTAGVQPNSTQMG